MTELEYLFDLYNSRYFRGSLPKIKVKYSDFRHFGQFRTTPVLRRSEGQALYDEKPCIEIAKWTKRSKVQIKLTLLHEMCHYKLYLKDGYIGHGNKFQREMKRLANAGAFRKLW